MKYSFKNPFWSGAVAELGDYIPKPHLKSYHDGYWILICTHADFIVLFHFACDINTQSHYTNTELLTSCIIFNHQVLIL